jgi:hypothetical protein
MKTRVFPLFFAASLAVAAGCARQESAREIDWAKAALARNPAYEIVATDDRAGIFTVRDTATGVVTTLRLEDLVAAPRPPKNAPMAAPAPVEPVEPVDAPAASAEALAAGQANQEAAEEVKAVPAPAGSTISAGPGYSISRGDQSAVAAATAPAPPRSLEGPGYSITREEPAARAARRDAEAVAPNVEKRSDPMICQGDRLMRIDGETLEFTGDALIAEKGCDLYISNSRISAGGVGLIARQARVHIVNSTIGGSQGSYEASDGAQIYVARSTFAGIGRRFDGASMTDLGGNSYTAN